MFVILGLEPEIKTLVLSPFFRLKFFYVLRMTFPVFGISPLNMDKLKVMFFSWLLQWVWGKEFAFNAEDTRDTGSVPELGRSPGEGNDNPLQYSCLENPMDRGVSQATVHGVARVRHDLVTKPPPSQLWPTQRLQHSQWNRGRYFFFWNSLDFSVI